MLCVVCSLFVLSRAHQCLNKGINCSQMMSTGKGSKVDLLTFKKWGKDGVIGYETVSIDNREFVNFVWCKVCARSKDALLHHPNCTGPVKKAIQNKYSLQITSFQYVCSTLNSCTHNVLGARNQLLLSSFLRARPDGPLTFCECATWKCIKKHLPDYTPMYLDGLFLKRHISNP